MSMPSAAQRNTLRGMTIVELLVVIAVISVLIGLLLPTLSRVREHSGEVTCASNLRQLSTATIAYLASWNDHLPQLAAFSPMSGRDEIIGALFGGKRGELEFFGINEIGADKRPLNRYLSTTAFRSDADDVPVFHCPLDRGQPGDGGAVPHTASMYDLIGTSYTLNDHTLDRQSCWTLVPSRTPACDPGTGSPADRKPGGKMPRVEDPAMTWVIGDQPIYNYEADPFTNPTGDRRQRWHFNRVQVNLAFVDGHVGTSIRVPQSSDDDGDGQIDQNTTKFYTFLPSRDWLEPNALGPGCDVCGP